MIIKNHTIELKDTSASEMARFRQIMLGIWRQQIEDDKNTREMEKYLEKHYEIFKTSHTQYANQSNKPAEITLKQDLYILNNENHYPYTDAIPLKEVIVTASATKNDSKDKNPVPAWIKIMQKYNDWIWWNFTIKSPNNNLQYFPFDARGYELYAHWAIGTGANIKYNEGHWGDYMRDNHYIEQGLKDAIVTKASIMKEEKISKANIERYTFRDGFEIENGYLTGYEMLHGTNKFTIVSGIANYNKNSDIYTFDLKLQWKDTINANAEQGDNEIAKFTRKINFGMPADYDIEINWSQKITISSEEINNYNKNNTFPEADNRRRR